jgi:hypothetical protein
MSGLVTTSAFADVARAKYILQQIVDGRFCDVHQCLLLSVFFKTRSNASENNRYSFSMIT